MAREVAKHTVLFTQAERNFLKENEACRIATCDNDEPHIAPVSYIFEENDTAGFIFFATDYDSKKYKNLKRNRKIALAIDVYNSSVDNKAVIIQGQVVEFIEGGEEFGGLYNLFHQRFEWVRREPWKQGEATFVKAAT